MLSISIGVGSILTLGKFAWSSYSNYKTSNKLKVLADDLHTKFFKDSLTKMPDTDVRVSIFSKSTFPFRRDFVLRARSLHVDQSSKKSFKRRKKTSAPHDGIVGYVISEFKSIEVKDLPNYLGASIVDKEFYEKKTFMEGMGEKQKTKFSYFARSYMACFVPTSDGKHVKYVILFESKCPAKISARRGFNKDLVMKFLSERSLRFL